MLSPERIQDRIEVPVSIGKSVYHAADRIPLPAPVSQLKGKTRQFWLSDCLDFAEQLKGTSAENK